MNEMRVNESEMNVSWNNKAWSIPEKAVLRLPIGEYREEQWERWVYEKERLKDQRQVNLRGEGVTCWTTWRRLDSRLFHKIGAEWQQRSTRSICNFKTRGERKATKDDREDRIKQCEGKWKKRVGVRT